MTARLGRSAVPSVLLAAALLGRAAAADPVPPGARVHALILVDSHDPNIGKAVAVDGRDVRNALKDGFKGREKLLSLTVLDGDGATPDAVTRYYRDLKVGPDDTILFYYSGHGGTDRLKGHFLWTQRRSIVRSDLLGEIRAKKARLTVFMTDCCANFCEIPQERPRAVGIEWDTLKSLLLRHRGIVDVNASSIGEVAWCDREGSLFTRAVLVGLGKTPADLGGESGGFVHWEDFFRYTRVETVRYFDAMKASDRTIPRDTTQVPQAFLLPPHRFGAVGTAGTDGLRVDRVYTGSPAEVARVRPGDVILKVGGVAVRTPEELEQALAKAGQTAAVEVRPKGQSAPKTYTVALNE